MKGGKKNNEPMQALQPPLDQEYNNGEAEEDEDEDEEETECEEEGSDMGEEADRPKLAEGFYEIECIRKKRMRKGQLQYLIKWRGWPETANTWEPLANVQSCADIIEAFEESLRASKSSKSSRKRKRKYKVPPVQPKKRRISSGTLDSAQGESLLLPTLDKSNFTNGNETNNTTVADKIEIEEHEQKRGSKEMDPGCTDLKRTSCIEENSRKISILLPESKPSEEDGSIDSHSKVGSTQPTSQSGRFIGAKKRKSGSVKRFKKDLASCELDEAQNAAVRSDKGEIMGTEDVESVGDEASDKHKLDDFTNSLRIIKIIKPIGYSASISNNAQDASVTFTALRSDGKEVVVDNKFLKANHPLLLINFYEQHLRYSPIPDRVV
ncbi:hypothetical protein MRB53_030064 [Persea americana]|uniref:Uncharacterized protein n=1 Tax=Persea americana TaxID=3435 RepID=A0ACC2KKJ9_PERAE|nr:hypothetical protein MRB53_030064 [Persea americana]|eukprot:TRINITY_DN5535_c1_g4_i1.p1 TRINITY_DN5535_c1_g4~~TRINITY_DN5535_c1_g4_i1.p1  ORF type:complete len:380 (+),score=95.06 TRINITY_DN5535_c1_g4_i1:241-1380(+)